MAKMSSPNLADWFVKKAMLIIRRKLRIIKSVFTLKKRLILLKSNKVLFSILMKYEL